MIDKKDMKKYSSSVALSDMEKYSSSVTLSDMEIFIFPELLYSLLLADIMSPVIWAWKDDEWFKDIENMTPYKRILRVKQFIMDNFDFNLDPVSYTHLTLPT